MDPPNRMNRTAAGALAIGNRVGDVKPSRGFESLPLRFYPRFAAKIARLDLPEPGVLCGRPQLRPVDHVVYVLQKALGWSLLYRLEPVGQDGAVSLLEQVAKNVILLQFVVAQEAVELSDGTEATLRYWGRGRA